MKVQLGHLVLNVRSLKISERFYRRVLGMKKRRAGTVNGNAMVFLTFGSKDHDIALLEVGNLARPPAGACAGLRHIGFRIGDQIAHLRKFHKHLSRVGITPVRTAEHRVSQSIYFRDPDGIEIEIYVDSKTPVWQSARQVRVTNASLHLA
jgi:catechol-2,3-dioxygenase